MMREVPMFIFTGMLESGKTTMINTLLRNPQLVNGRKILLLLCEEGEETYDEEALAAKNVSIRTVEEEERFNATTFRKLDRELKPDYVIIEFNGMWSPETYLNVEYPKGYGIAEIMTSVDSSTFQVYLNNMRPLMAAQYRATDMVVFNRFRDDFNKISFRSVVKAQNLAAKVIFEYEDGTIDADFDASPFDLTQDTIDIADSDFGLFYFDAMERVDKYDGKTVKALVRAAHFTGNAQKTHPGFLVGRVGMTCCEADQQFLGLVCLNSMDFEDGWYRMTATVEAGDGRMYGEAPEPKLPVLRVQALEPAEKPEQEVVGL